MSKTIVKLDSHQLSAFKRCPRQFFLHYKLHKEGLKPKEAFLKGNAIHDLLYHFYTAKIVGEKFEDCSSQAIEKAKPIWEQIQGNDRLLVLRKFGEYGNYYRNEAIKAIGVEVGFSKTFYEDSDFLFIYEGKIDFIAEIERGRLAWVDHKTQAYAYDLIGEVNQFMGYSWALGYNTGMINYIGMQESKGPKDAFRRQICTYSAALIQEWYKTTLRSYFQLAHLGETFSNFEKDRTGCQAGKFGNCDFLRVCKETSPNIISGILEKEYQERPQWIPWE